ncbi:MAG: 4'-phosphopantetheinyl transferase superfamily protein [Candidatus Brocadiaceae bacterium]|nr:4'-phosphopantetheinyl transferase superfamily protein [Candidatus Brocadiaceae bacterium]
MDSHKTQQKIPIACGVDIESTSRLENLLGRGLLPREIFSTFEWKKINSNNSLVGLYFTIKEAMLKALGIGWLYGPVAGSDIEIRMNKDGQMELILHGIIKAMFYQRGFRVIENSHCEYNGNFVAAIVLKNLDYSRTRYYQTITDVSKIKKKSNLLMVFPCNEKQIRSEGAKASHLAGRLAVKQSIASLVKTLNDTLIENRLNEIEIINDELGRPHISNTKNLMLPSNTAISISHTKQYAIGIAAAY